MDEALLIGPDNSLFCFVDIGTFLAQVEFCLVTGIHSFNLQKCSVLPLVSEASFVASKSGLGPQPRELSGQVIKSLPFHKLHYNTEL